MKILDPQSALLTTSEVHVFLLSKPPRPPPKRIGSYEAVNTKGYQRVREDFLEYIDTLVPYIAKYPPPETFVKNVVPKLRAFGLTKTEVLMMINLGLGLARGQHEQQELQNKQQQSINGHANGENVNGEGEEEAAEDDHAAADGDEEQAEEAAAVDEESQEPDDEQLLYHVVEELGERFTKEDIQNIFDTIRDEYNRAHAIYASTKGNDDAMNGP